MVSYINISVSKPGGNFPARKSVGLTYLQTMKQGYLLILVFLQIATMGGTLHLCSLYGDIPRLKVKEGAR